MKHFNFDLWVDYARGLVADATAERIAEHVGRCGECASMATQLSRVREAGAYERNLSPPEWAVRSVQAVFATARSSPDNLPSLALLAGTALAGAAAGQRSGESATRHLFFQSDDYGLELSIDPLTAMDRDPRPRAVVGRWICASDEPLSRAPVQLLADGELTAVTMTDELGAFSFDCEHSEPFELRIWPNREGAVGVTVPDPGPRLETPRLSPPPSTE